MRHIKTAGGFETLGLTIDNAGLMEPPQACIDALRALAARTSLYAFPFADLGLTDVDFSGFVEFANPASLNIDLSGNKLSTEKIAALVASLDNIANANGLTYGSLNVTGPEMGTLRLTGVGQVMQVTASDTRINAQAYQAQITPTVAESGGNYEGVTLTLVNGSNGGYLTIDVGSIITAGDSVATIQSKIAQHAAAYIGSGSYYLAINDSGVFSAICGYVESSDFGSANASDAILSITVLNPGVASSGSDALFAAGQLHDAYVGGLNGFWGYVGDVGGDEAFASFLLTNPVGDTNDYGATILTPGIDPDSYAASLINQGWTISCNEPQP